MKKYNSIFFTDNFLNNSIAEAYSITFPITYPDFTIDLEKLENAKITGYNVYLKTHNEEKANELLRLIHASMSIINLELAKEFYVEDYILVDSKAKVGQFLNYSPSTIIACKAASQAYGNQSQIFAIYKLKLSVETSSCNTVDLHPHEYLDWKSDEDKTRFAYSIILSYSVLEELGLEVRASRKNPSKDEKGNWNQNVLYDLKSRLDKIGVPKSKTTRWYLRGNLPQLKKEPKIHSSFKYSYGENIRDAEVKIEDAISYLSYLRSQISSHKFGGKIFELNIYDVKSSQNLAQLVLLHALNLQ